MKAQVSQKSERGDEEKVDEKDKHLTLLDFRRWLISNMEDQNMIKLITDGMLLFSCYCPSWSAHIRVTERSQMKAGRSEFDSV